MKAKRGFTMVEMLAVIAVLGILMGIVVGLAGQAGRRSDRAKAQTDLQMIRTALEEYRHRNGEYPEPRYFARTLNDYAYDWYRRTLNRDPWGNTYNYFRTAPLEYHLWSKGPSGVHHVSGNPPLPTEGHDDNRDNVTR